MKKETADDLLKLSREEYDKYALEFSDTRQCFWEELKFLKEYVDVEYKVLDIGCGNGRLLDLFENIDINYTGVDSSKELIAIAQKLKGFKGTFIQADALSLPLEDNSFDAVFSIAVLHHIPSKENRMKFISEAHRVLKPGGIFVFTVWNTLQWKFAKTHLIHFFKKIFGFSKLDFGDIIISFGNEKRQRYIHSFTKHGIRNLFKKNNFADIYIQEVKRESGYANFVVIAKNKS